MLSEYVQRCTSSRSSSKLLKKIKRLRYLLEVDLLGCDAKWTLFVAAALSFRYDARMFPFPPNFTSWRGGLDINRLISVIKATPKLDDILERIRSHTINSVWFEVLNLLYWLLVESSEYQLRLIESQDMCNWIRIMHRKGKEELANIFTVYRASTQKSPSFNMGGNTEIAFYGDRLDCFYAMINKGFQQNETLLLTKNFLASLERSPYCGTQGASVVGSMICCVAVCEFINDSKHVRHKQVLSRNRDCIYDAIEVRSDLVSIRHLIFYGINFWNHKTNAIYFNNFIYRHKYLLSLTVYIILLTTISLVIGQSRYPYKEVLVKYIQWIFNIYKRIFFWN